MSAALSLFHPARLLATGFGSGYFPLLSGTFGTFVALLIAWPLHALGNAAMLAASLTCFVAGVVVCQYYLKHMPENKDPREIVIDEFAAMWLLLAFMPRSLLAYVIAFLLFRFFDIFKPYPVNLIDRKIVGAFGIMIDDIAAACYPVLLFIIYCGISGWMGSPVDIDEIHNWLMTAHVF